MFLALDKYGTSKDHQDKKGDEHTKEAIRRLCHFVPTDEKENIPALLHELLVKHAVVALGRGSHSLSDIRGSLHRIFNLDFEEEEIEGAIERLKENKSVIPRPRGLYSLDVNTYSELEKSVKDSTGFDRTIIDQWFEEINKRYIGLSEDDLKLLEEDLRVYLAKIFLRHGAECVALIYAGREEIGRFVDELKDDVFTFLATRSSRLHRIRIIELPNFFKNASTERKRYIAQLLDCTFIIHMLHVDKYCSVLIRKEFKNCRVYLDTNFVYGLLGLHGPVLQRGAEKTIEVAHKLGVIFMVSTRTVEEWNESIEFAVKQLRKYRLSPVFGKIVAEYTTEGDFITAYWREHEKTGISIDDFFAICGRIEELLEPYDIKIKDTLCDIIKKDPQLKKEIGILDGATSNMGYLKPLKIAEHDAFHRLLVLRMRGKIQPKTFIDTKVWFLTCDNSLSVYDRIARKGPRGVPFCILANQWIQIMRPLIPRTVDFDETFADLLTSPYLKTYGSLSSDVAQKIIARITQFKPHSPELALKVLMDRHLTGQLSQTKDEEKAIELIDSATAKAADEFRKERDELKDQLMHLKKEKEEVEADKLRLARRITWASACSIWIGIGLVTLFIPWVSLHYWAKSFLIAALVVGAIGALSFPLGKSKTWKILGGAAVLFSILSSIWSFIKK